MLPETEERELYTLPDGTLQWLTASEAADMGFCPTCGAFVDGIDSEIPYMSKWGMCSECLDELRDETERDSDFADY